MTTIDNSKAILDGVFSDRTVTVPANTTYAAYTVLGLNASGKLVAYSTDLDNGYTPASGDDPAVEAFKAEPSYILAHSIENSTNAAVDYPLARVLECGDVDIAKAVFVKAADATDPAVLSALKNNGIRLVHVDYATAQA